MFAQLFHFVVSGVVRRARRRRDDHDGDGLGQCDFDVGDDLFIRQVRGFGQGQDGREFADHDPVFGRGHVGVTVGPDDLAADAVMEAGDEARNDLFDLGQAVERGMSDHEGRMAGVVVEVDDLADIVHAGGCLQQEAFPRAVAVERLELVEELGGNARDLVVVSLVDDDAAQRTDEVLDAEIEDVVETR